MVIAGFVFEAGLFFLFVQTIPSIPNILQDNVNCFLTIYFE